MDTTDIRDFGAVPGRSGARATRLAIQAALDALPESASGSGRTRCVLIPSAPEPWCLDRPVYLDRTRTGLRGDPGGGSNIEMDWHHHASCFLLGMPRDAFGQSLDAGHFVDLFGKLDASAASAPGQRWGLRTCGDAHVAQGAGPLSYGLGDFAAPDYWGKTRQLTVEFATDATLTPFDGADAVYLGLSDRGQPQPFVLIGQLGRFAVWFKTSDGKLRGFNFALPTGDGVKRIAFQIDLAAGCVSAFLDGLQVAVDGHALGLDFASAAGSGLTFTANLNIPFKFASAGFGANSFGSDWWTDNTRKDRTLYGLRVSNGVRYVVGSPDEAQRRLDGRPVNDFYSYFDLDMQTVALFPFQDAPAQVVQDRFLEVRTLAGSSVALYLSANHGSTFTAKTYNSLSDLSITSHDPAYGAALTLGFALHLAARNCTLSGGAHGIGTWNWGSNYVTRLQNCQVQGNDAAIYSNYAMLAFDGVQVAGHGRSTFWVNGSRLRGSHAFCDDGGTPEYVVRASRGSDVVLSDFTVDFESAGGPYPSHGAFLGESSAANGGSSGGRLLLRDVNFGTIGRDTPLVTLRQGSPYDPPAQFELDGLVLVGEEYRALVLNEATNWTGVIRGVFPDPVFPVLENAPGCGGVTSEHDTMSGPPRATRWLAGAHVLKTPRPVAGQFAQWDCVRTGEYGTPEPPRWAGSRVVSGEAGALAAYGCGHSYWSAEPWTLVDSGSGHPDWTAGVATLRGFWTERVHAAILNRLCGGPANGPLFSGPLSLGLSLKAASRTGVVQECTGAGYARVPLGRFAVGSDGQAAHRDPVRFPTVPDGADWGDVRSLFVVDTGSGAVLAALDLDRSVVARSLVPGRSLGLAAGSLRVRRVDCALGALTASAAADAVLNGAPWAVGPHWLALSRGPAGSGVEPWEPSGGSGYARVPVPADAWSPAEWGTQWRLHQRGTVETTGRLTFPAAVRPWDRVQSLWVMDAPAGGSVVLSASLTAPVDVRPGDPALSVAAGALWVSLR